MADNHAARPYRLYGRLETGSASSEAMLELCGAPYEVIDVPGERAAAEAEGYLSINPRGQVPALAHPDGTIITEGPVILLHLADAFPSKHLAPAPGSSARALHDRWLSYFHANVYEGELRRFYPDRYTNDPAGADAVKAAALDYVQRHYEIFEQTLGPTDYAFGDKPQVLDVYLWMLVQWMDRDWMASHCPRTIAISDRLSALPLVRPIQARHFGDAS